MRLPAAWVSLEVVLVRAGAGGAALAALLLAMPGIVTTHPLGPPALVLLALPVALWPRGPWATVVVLAAVAGWLVPAEGEVAPPVVRLLLLAAALYLVHSLTALAVAVPQDARVAPGVVLRWVLRALLVVLAAWLFSVGVLAAVDARQVGEHHVATVVGLVAAGCLVVLLSLVARWRTAAGRRQ